MDMKTDNAGAGGVALALPERSADIRPSLAPPPSTGTVQFLGKEKDYWRLMIRGALLLMATLGIYRFWLATDMRRFLWANTETSGETLEYTGTPIELLTGFLIAIAILVPLYAGIFLAALDLGVVGQLAGVIGFVMLAVLGKYAAYRARRYRLSRTVFRGLRFHQTGSAWRYALLSVMWWVIIGLTFGLAYPWSQTSLERYKLKHTHYGDLSGHFAASPWKLFAHGIALWLVVVAPLVVGIGVLIAFVDWAALVEAASQGGDNVLGRIEGSNMRLAVGIVVALSAGIWSVLAAIALYPVFQGIVLRWWASGLRFGEVSFTSELRLGQVYAVYLRFLLFGILFGMAAAIAAGIILVIVGVLVGGDDASTASEIVAALIAVGGYVVVALGFSTIYQVAVKFGLWRCLAQSLKLSNVSALETVAAKGRPSSPVGEGLADALNVGGW
jgi:uncharacterized membrane protein YjgN (DUF898 family)